jgi:hypothetical protein
MARTFQLEPVAGLLLDPGDVFPVDRSGADARRASQAQVLRALLSLPDDGAVDFPDGSYGALLLGGGGGSGGGSISSFSSTPGPIVEAGSAVTDPVLAWSLTPMNVTGQTLAGPLAVPLNTSQRGVVLPGTLTTDANWALTVNAGGGVLTANVTLAFGHNVHWGRAGTTLANSAAVLALSGARLLTGAAGDYPVVANAGATPYWWFCYPDSWGGVVIRDAATGLPAAISDTGTISVLNASGHTRSFRCLRSLNALNGAMTLRVT